MYPLYGVLIATAIRMLVMLGLGYLVIAFTPDSFPGTIKGIGFHHCSCFGYSGYCQE